jgi:type II secretory pathway pseudopilin PulG
MKHQRAAFAFTFVEVLAALVFLGILMPVVVSALLNSNRAAVIAERSEIAAQLGENQLNELLLADQWTSAASRGDFGESWPGYRWELRKANWVQGGMTEVTLDVFYTVQGQERTIQLATLAADSQ